MWLRAIVASKSVVKVRKEEGGAVEKFLPAAAGYKSIATSCVPRRPRLTGTWMEMMRIESSRGPAFRYRDRENKNGNEDQKETEKSLCLQKTCTFPPSAAHGGPPRPLPAPSAGQRTTAPDLDPLPPRVPIRRCTYIEQVHTSNSMLVRIFSCLSAERVSLANLCRF